MFLRYSARLGRARAYGLLFAAAVGYVCPAWAQLAGTAPEGAATVISLVGRVDKLVDSAPWALNMGDWVKPGQFIVTGPDGGAIFRLSDGSTFEIYSNSRIMFRPSPGNSKELLDVFLGNIKVHIQKLGGQPNHNRVRPGVLPDRYRRCTGVPLTTKLPARPW